MSQGQNQKPQVVRPNAPTAAVKPAAPAVPKAPESVEEAAAAVEAEAKEEAKPEGYTPQEAAQVLGGAEAGFTGKSIRRHVRGGTCPATKHGGRWYITESQLETYLENLETAAKAKAEAEAARAAEAAAKAAAEAQAAAEEESES